MLIKECLINGKKIEFDKYSSKLLPEAIDYFKGYEYVGSGYIYFTGNERINSRDILHYFKRK